MTSVKIWVIVAMCQLVAITTPHRPGIHLSAIVMTVVFYVVLHRALWADDEPDKGALAAH